MATKISLIVMVCAAALVCAVSALFDVNAQQGSQGETARETPMEPDRVFEINANGVQLRIPGRYLAARPLPSNGFPDATKIYDDLSFSFWVSDGQPARYTFVGREKWWPPIVGRPSQTDADFVVDVFSATFLPAEEGMRRQQNMRPLPPGQVDRKHGIDCITSPGGAMRCLSSIEDDPAVNMSSSNPQANNPSWRLRFYSRADRLSVGLDFPFVGFPRWRDVICRTQALIRTWRVADGPVPPDCANLPRVVLR